MRGKMDTMQGVAVFALGMVTGGSVVLGVAMVTALLRRVGR
jgi:hypothetical protein